ncbi:MAG: hypothetical protein RL497_723 [Pseudomonadota bacterium]
MAVVKLTRLRRPHVGTALCKLLLWLATTFAAILASFQALSAEPILPPQPSVKPVSAADDSPMMLYLVPWNTHSDTTKNSKTITLYKPWGVHFDPLTPAQTADLAAP